MTPVVLAVGTTHPSPAAGLLLELETIRALGARAVAVVAGVSAQDAARVLARAAVDPATIAAQFDALAGVPVAAASVGALLDPLSVEAVAVGLAAFPAAVVVCDPVIAASGGGRLADAPTLDALRAALFPRCTLLTPNLPEAEVLTGERIDSPGAMRRALPALAALGPAAVLLKGGHLAGEPCDLLWDGSEVHELRAERLPVELRGTGSLLAAAIATRSALGDRLLDAVVAARAVVRERIVGGTPFAGMRLAL